MRQILMGVAAAALAGCSVQVGGPVLVPLPAEVPAEMAPPLEVTMPAPDAPPEPLRLPAAAELPVAGRLEMRSTAYCLRGNMRTGVRTREGMAAADPAVLPLGSVVRVSHADGRPLGVYVIMDTGGAVRGNTIDLWMASCDAARAWGVRAVVAEVVELGARG